jgi:hypothetical protein
MKLQAHQTGTIEYLEKKCANQHGLLVFHNMGTGKTITAVSWLINRKMQYRAHPTAIKKRSPTAKHNLQKHSKKRTKHIRKSQKRRTKHNRISAAPRQRASGGSGSRASRASRASRTDYRPRVVTKNRDFDYLIVCPENIKSSWQEDANKIGFKIDMSKVINYEKVQGRVQAKEFDVTGKNVIFDEAHHLCKIMRYENMEYYTAVLRALSKADKLLLMTGTPEHGGKSDFMILVNLVARRNKFPVHDKQLYEMYRKNDIFQKRKNSIFFNWVKPVAWTAFLSIYNYIHSRLYKKLREWTYLYLFKRYNLSLHSRAKEYVKLSKRGQLMQEEDFGGDDMYGGGFLSAKKNELLDATNQTIADIGEKASQVPTSRKGTKKMLGHMFDNAVNEEMDNYTDQGVLVVHEIAQEIDSYIKNQPTRSFMAAFQKYAFASFGFLQVTHNPEIALAQAPMDLERMSRDIGRYVSFYQQPSDSLDYGKTSIEAPTEALYNTYQSQQCLFFIFGTMTERMVRFYADVDHDGAKLKINEFRTMKGVWRYGRCISNMWGIVDCILDKQVKYVFDDKDGTVRLRYRHKKDHHSRKKQHGGHPDKSHKTADTSNFDNQGAEGEIVQTLSGCSKFKNVARMIREAEKKGERTFIRSDFKKQGIYLLSAYLNSVGIKHYYIRSTMNPAGRTRILKEFNNVYRPVMVNGKRKAVVLEYIDDTKPNTDNAQVYTGVTVVPTRPNKTWTTGRVINIDTNKNAIEVMYDELLKKIITVTYADIQRVFTVRYEDEIGSDGKAKQQVVKSSDFELLPYDGPTTLAGERLPSVMLLDKDSSEGISLMGIEHVHLLEPLLSVAERDQSLARAVRFQSHRHLPTTRHMVKIYTHVGVVKPSKRSLDSAKALFQAQLFDTEKNAHINKHFAGVVPRAAKGTIKTDPVGYMFDKYWNAVPVLHSGFDGTSSTPDTMVLGRVSADAKHIGAYTSRIRKHNVIYKDFDKEFPSDCEANNDKDFTLKTEGF